MISDPSKGAKNDRPNPADPADSRNGEGLASMRPRLARTLADSASRSADRQPDAMTTPTPLEPAPPGCDTPGPPKP